MLMPAEINEIPGIQKAITFYDTSESLAYIFYSTISLSDIERGKIGKGDEVLAEAWCYGAEGEELGYIAAEGRLVPSYSVGVLYGEPSSEPFCFTGRTAGKYIPCIDSSIIEQ